MVIAANVYVTLYAKPVTNPVYILTILILIINLGGTIITPLYRWETEAQRDSMTCPNTRARNWTQAQILTTERYCFLDLEVWPGLCLMHGALV